MVQLLLILLFASIYLHDQFLQGTTFGLIDPSQYPMRIAGITLAGFYFLWVLFHLLTSWCGRRIDQTGRARWVRTAERGMTVVRVFGMCWWAFALTDIGWLRAIRGVVGDWVLLDELLA